MRRERAIRDRLYFKTGGKRYKPHNCWKTESRHVRPSVSSLITIAPCQKASRTTQILHTLDRAGERRYGKTYKHGDYEECAPYANVFSCRQSRPATRSSCTAALIFCLGNLREQLREGHSWRFPPERATLVVAVARESLLVGAATATTAQSLKRSTTPTHSTVHLLVQFG